MITYPIYGKLSNEVIDEITHYNAYKKFRELLGEDMKLTIVYFNPDEESIKDIKKIVPYGEILRVEDYMENLNALIEELFHQGKLEVMKKVIYYCEECNKYYHLKDVKWEKREEVRDIVRVRMGRRLYFIGDVPKGVEPVGIAINDSENLLAVKMDKDFWVSPAYMREILINEIEVSEEDMEEVKIGDLKKRTKLVNYVITGDVETGYITKENMDLYDLKRKISSYVVIYSVKKEIKEAKCPSCGRTLEKREIPILTVKTEKGNLRISSQNGNYKIPILYCDSCGNFEFGTRIKDCPICGNIMETKFFYDPKVLSLGTYYKFNEESDILYVHEKRSGILNIMKLLDEKNENLFDKEIILHHKFEDDGHYDSYSLSLLKNRGSINENDKKKIEKLKNFILNLVNYMQIYGKSEPKDKIDNWLIFRNEQVKKEYISRLKDSKFACGFDLLYNYVANDISRFYLHLKRKESIVFEPIVDSIRMLYPYLPDFSLEMLSKLNIENLKLEISEVKEEEGIDSLRNLIRVIMRFREENKITRREPLKKIVFVSEQADEIKEFATLIMKFTNTLVFNSTGKWDEMELDVEPDIQAIGQMYRAWAPKIAFLLKRKNVKDVISALNKGGYTMGIEGFIVRITPNMVKLIEKVPKGYIKLNTKIGSLYVNAERDVSTMRIRLINEVIRRINYMRKDLDVEYDDLIDISIQADESINRIIKSYVDEIRERTRARNVDFRYIEYAYVVEWPIMDYDIVIGINPLFKKWVIKAFESIPGIAANKAELLFHMGYGSIYELMQASPGELAEVPGFSTSSANKIRDYLYKNAFKPKKSGKKEYCPFCGTELGSEDDFCPRCGAPIRVKMERKSIGEGNVYMTVGEFSKIIARIPPELIDNKKLLITKEEPEDIKSTYNLKNAHIIWISYVPIGKSIKPKELNRLRDEIEKFLGRGGKLILMDCFDFMTAINGFDTMLDFLKELREDVKSVNAHLFFNVEELEEENGEKILEYVDGEI